MPSTGVPITQVSMLAACCDVHMARCLYCSWGVAPSPEGLFWRCVCVTLLSHLHPATATAILVTVCQWPWSCLGWSKTVIVLKQNHEA